MLMIVRVFMFVMMPMPMTMLFSIGNLSGFMIKFGATLGQCLLEILWTMRVIVILTDRPFIQQRIALIQTRPGTILVFNWGRPGIVMEMVEQLGVNAPESDTAQLTGKGAMINIGRAPEIPSGRNITKLHHPGGSPQVIGFLGAIVIGNIVLIKIWGHTI